MTKVIIITVLVLAALAFERLSISFFTRSEKHCQWIRNHSLLHPNTISLIRIPMGIISVGLWMFGWKTAAIFWFAIWMITDLTDGTIARKCNLETERGKWLDPFSDKCMYFPGLIFFAVSPEYKILPGFWVAILLLTDTLGQMSRLWIKKKAANHFGKAKTALLTVLLSLVTLNYLHPFWFMSQRFVYLLTLSCALLAFLSFYCKVIPDMWYANSLTLVNFLCGLGAIWYIVQGQALKGFVLVFVGQFFDLFDGRLARKYGSTRHGAVFDDFADGTSFGLAISFLIYLQLPKTPLTVVVAVLYVLAVIYRLYRFLKPKHSLPDGIFQGMPAPAGALMAGSSVLLFGDSYPLAAVFLVLLTSVLMVSLIQYRHFGHLIWPELPKTLKLLLFVLLLIYVNISIADQNYSRSFILFCFVLSLMYVVLGLNYGFLRRSGTASKS